jgi:4-diphosphocytidyl-2-C-methyl-D-erythritol kinase
MTTYKAPAKVNIFLKITGTRGEYHEILSRFMRLEHLYDTLYFEKKEPSEALCIVGNFTCNLEDNTIYKAYAALKSTLSSKTLSEFMAQHSVVVEKNIPAFAGLGGGSSDAATFLLMCNEQLHLGLSANELMKIGAKVGADVPFFISGFSSANVSGIGEIVERFDEAPLELEVITPQIEISTPRVYKSYRMHFFNPIHTNEAKALSQMHSVDILKQLGIHEANDLFKPACREYPELKAHQQPHWFFSGSGSSFFKVKNHG